MIFEWLITVPADTPTAAPVLQIHKLTHGIVHKVEVVGDGGERNAVFLSLRRGLHQVWPTNPDGQLHPHLFPISYPVFQPLEAEPYQLEAYAWSPGTSYTHYIIVRLGVMPREILMPGTEAIGIMARMGRLLLGR